VLNNLQNLRALAAYSVVFYHCLMRFVTPGDPIGRAYLDLPSGGVDLFFVISGFVMVHTTRDDEKPYWFATKRVARIVPLYWAATAIVIAMVLLRDWIFPNVQITAESIFSSLFFIPHTDASGKAFPILGVGWTLNYEMMFYALFAISLFLPTAWRLIAVISMITLVWLTATIAKAANVGGGSVIADFYAHPIIFEFAAGCIIAHALRMPAVVAFVRGTPMWPIALVGFAAFLLLPALAPAGTSTVLRYGAPAVLVVFAVAAQDLYRAPARESFVTRLGDASYSAYLLHPIVIAIMGQAALLTVGTGLLAEGVILVATLVGTAVVSLYSMKHFEKPTAAFLRNCVRPRHSLAGH
jgi:exopolysaccharide production protein ExoZ